MRARRQEGQAVPEYVGIVVVLAVLMGALALIASRSGWLGGRGSPHLPAPALPTPPLIDLAPPAARSGGRLTRLRRSVSRGVRVTARGVVAAARGFGDAARRDLEAFLRDPAGSLQGGGDAVEAFARHPVASTRAIIDDARAYAVELRAMPGDEAFVRFMGDLGAVAEDVAVARGKGLLRRRMLRKLRERMERTPRTPDPPSGPTQ